MRATGRSGVAPGSITIPPGPAGCSLEAPGPPASGAATVADIETSYPLAAIALLVAGGLALYGEMDQARLSDIESANEGLEAQLAPLAGLPDTASLQDAVAEIERRQAVVDSLQKRSEGVALITAASGAVGTGPWLTSLDWDGDSVKVQGLGFDPTAAADVMQGMQDTGCFSEVTLLSVDTAAGGGPLRFSIVAADAPGDCGSTTGLWGKPFTPPHDPAMGPDINRPALLRWDVALYRVLALDPGVSATVRDPDGRSHSVAVGNMLGRPAAKVTFITDTAVILSQDTLVDASTDTLQSTILELPLDPAER